MEKIRIALVGLGGRGAWWLGELLKMEDADVTAVCDLRPERLEKGAEMCRNAYGHEVFASDDYKEVAARPDNDAVFAPTSWNDHIRVSIAAMKAGKYAASEVGPGQSIQQCWDLVRTSEETGMPFMMLENCCYNREEMAVLNMVKKGIFGEVIHVGGGYRHDLRGIAYGFADENERSYHNLSRNAELYPTHELGPMMTWLGINRGNRMITLTATASKSRGINEFSRQHNLEERTYNQGDVVKTIIRCANGETMELTHDIALPHPYSRVGLLEGTKGIWLEDKHSVYIDGMSPNETWEDISTYYDKYDHPLWRKSGAADFTGGHGGMDWLVMRAFLDAVRNRTQTPFDVYDAASMMAVSVLSEQSIALGSAPMAIPDFTDGRWIHREPAPKTVFSLTEVDEELFK